MASELGWCGHCQREQIVNRNLRRWARTDHAVTPACFSCGSLIDPATVRPYTDADRQARLFQNQLARAERRQLSC